MNEDVQSCQIRDLGEGSSHGEAVGDQGQHRGHGDSNLGPRPLRIDPEDHPQHDHDQHKGDDDIS